MISELQLESKKSTDALRWIINILNKHHIIYQVTGGLAAKVYGAKRSLADIDLDLPGQAIRIILSEVKPYIICGPKRFRDEQWDILLLTIDYHGQLIDISGADDGLIFDRINNQWEKCEVDFSAVVEKKIDDIVVKVISKADLIKYKSVLKREVDILDLSELTN
ncbi:MAG TPA: hypothetical protein VLJ15_07350 [Gammaproteobacteria bacterium]|nr:hypothetical protein [Gammaproteobacteria bacterium]